MTLRELIEELTDIAECTSDERTVMVATQPSYPLAARLVNVYDPSWDLLDPADEVGDDTVVWLATGTESDYAPSAAWNG